MKLNSRIKFHLWNFPRSRLLLICLVSRIIPFPQAVKEEKGSVFLLFFQGGSTHFHIWNYLIYLTPHLRYCQKGLLHISRHFSGRPVSAARRKNITRVLSLESVRPEALTRVLPAGFSVSRHFRRCRGIRNESTAPCSSARDNLIIIKSDHKI